MYPALAVGRVLRERGHRLLFIGTPNGMESRLVPDAGFPMAFVRSGGLNRVGLAKQLRTAAQLPASVASAWRILRKFRPAAVFSTGGYVAGPVMLAALAMRIPLIVMEPNMTPGFANRKVAKRVYRALLGFAGAEKWFGRERSEVTGLPIRPEFFRVPPRRDERPFTVLITGGSLGARTLNIASRESWPLFRDSRAPVRLVHQTGSAAHYQELARDFAETGLAGEVVPFISNMPGAFAEADLVVCRAGAGTVNELSAAGMASILVPLPFAADDHQRKNAEALVAANAARMLLNAELTGERLFREVEALRHNPAELAAMRQKIRQFAKPGAAERAADVMEEAARTGKHA